MAESKQYLRIGLHGRNFLLASDVSVSIEQRDNLVVEPTGRVTAWRVNGGDRWPAFYLDNELRLNQDDRWERAVFIDAHPRPIGLIANEIQLLPHGGIEVEPFAPLGSPPNAAGHLFSAVWVRGNQLVLVFAHRNLVAYLRALERAA